MITTTRRPPENDAGHAAGPACPDGRLLALKCLGIPQVATRAAMSSRRTLLRTLAAFCARIRPRNTAELASLVLYLGEEIDRRERMLDAALRAMVTVPGERAPGSPAASRPPARAGSPDDHGLKLIRAVRAGCDLPNSSQPVMEEECIPDLGFARHDLCSIRTADEQEELAEAVRTGFSTDGPSGR